MLLDGEVVALDGGRPELPRPHRADARRRPASRPAPGRHPSGDPDGLRPAAPVRLRPHRPTVVGETGAARAARPDRPRTGRCPRSTTTAPQLLAATKEQGLEGIVSKRRTAPYAAGRRSPDWRKTAHRASLSVVVGGWRPEVGSNGRLGAVLVGLPDGSGGWRYAGRVGSGLAGTAGEALAMRLRPLAPRHLALRRRGARDRRERHHLGRAAASSSRCAPSSSPASTGCASRPTSACAPT